MTLHANVHEVQDRGCRCVELLAPLVPLPLSTPTAVLTPVLAAARRFGRRQNVVSGACGALRAICSLALVQAARGDGALVAAVQEEGVADCAEQTLQSYADPSL